MTFGALHHNPLTSEWVITRLEPHAIIRLKQLFPHIPKGSPPPYVFKDKLETALDLQWFESRYAMDMSRVDRLKIEMMCSQHQTRRAEQERILAGDYSPPLNPGIREIDPVTGKPNAIREIQKLPINLLSSSRRVLCADEIGTGKSYIAMGATLIPGALPAAMVVQTHLQSQFVNKFERFTTLKIHKVGQTKLTKGKLPEADVHIFKYNQLFACADYFESWGFKSALFDEVQELRRGDEAQKGQGARRLIQTVDYVMGLSATPIYNYGVEIWNIMNCIDPDLLGPRDDFLREWAPNGHILDPDALSSYMKDQGRFIRRTKKEMGVEMPPVNKIVQEINFDEKTLADAEKLAEQLAIKATTGSFTERGRSAMELDMKMRQATGIAKAKGIASFIRMCIEGGTPVIVGLWHREVYAIILKQLEDLKPIMYTGSETLAQKDKAKADFLENPMRPFLMSIRSGAGLDGLQAVCSTAIVGELDWSPKIMDQFIGRLDRDGQTEPVTAFYLTVDEGSDPVLQEVNGLKNAEITALMDAGQDVQEIHTDPSNLTRLVQKYARRARG